MQRYYSGNYDRLSDPSDPFDPTIRSANATPVQQLGGYESEYHSRAPSFQQDTGYQPQHSHTYSQDAFQPLADDYEEYKGPKNFSSAVSPRRKWYQVQWTRKKKIIAWVSLVVLVIIIAAAIGVGVFFKETAFSYTPSRITMKTSLSS